VAMEDTAERIAAVLQDGSTLAWCIDCLGARLDLSSHDVRNAAQILVAGRAFEMTEGVCRACGRIEHVIVAVAPSSEDES